MSTQWQRGLTMVEVLVALAITAIALLAAGQAMRSMIHAAARQEQVTLAQLCAENQLVNTRLARNFPAVGQQQMLCEQMGRQFTVKLWVSATANPSFRRVQAQVFEGSESVLSIATVIGRY